MKTCSFIGHRKIEVTEKLKIEVKKFITQLIEKHGTTVFLFGSKSMFNDMCYDIVSELKKIYTNIQRINIRAEYPVISEEYLNYLRGFYEDSVYYDDSFKTGKLSYIKRNEALIDKSDFCVFYYDCNYKPASNTKSGTSLAYSYATKKNKKVFNLYIRQ